MEIIIVFIVFVSLFAYAMLGMLAGILTSKINEMMNTDFLYDLTTRIFEDDPYLWMVFWGVVFPFWLLCIIFLWPFKLALFIGEKIGRF